MVWGGVVYGPVIVSCNISGVMRRASERPAMKDCDRGARQTVMLNELSLSRAEG